MTGYGDAQFTMLYDAGHATAVRCDRADPCIRISPVLIRQWHEPGHSPFLSLACAGPPACPIGDVAELRCVNGLLAYRVTGTEPGWLEGPDSFAYLAELRDAL